MWFRVYCEARTDAKLKILTDRQFRLWFNLLCYAAEKNFGGVIEGYNPTLLAIEVADGDEDELKETLSVLEKLKIVSVEENKIIFINFNKRQGKIQKKKEKEQKTKYADCVFLTEEQYQKLLDKHGEVAVKRMIEILNNYKASTGRRYKSDYHAILNWVVQRYKQDRRDKPTKKPEYKWREIKESEVKHDEKYEDVYLT